MKAQIVVLIVLLSFTGLVYSQEIKMKFLTKSNWLFSIEDATEYKDGDIITLTSLKRNHEVPWHTIQTAYNFSKNGRFNFLLEPMGLSIDQSGSNWQLTDGGKAILVESIDTAFKLELIKLTKHKMAFYYRKD
ncbi:MAG: hypothetical protein ACI9J3_000357 [Parvicellaceae bacterium]|jgi:hypothetical protein